LPAGRHVLRVAFDANGSIGYVGNFDSIAINTATGENAQTPFNGTPFKPGDRVHAEDFDLGGEGVAYHDTDPANVGGLYRPNDGVDVQPTTDSGGGHIVGFIRPGEWLEYTVDAAESANYDFLFRVASLKQGGTWRLIIDGQTFGAIGVRDTGGWENWIDLPINDVPLTAGQHVIRLQMDFPGALGYVMNLNWFEFRKSA
jgi:hypothetical protein